MKNKKTICKKDLIAHISAKTGLSLTNANYILTSMIDEIKEALVQEKEITFANFGRFKVHKFDSTIIKHPQTLEKIELPHSYRARFQASLNMKEKINPKKKIDGFFDL